MINISELITDPDFCQPSGITIKRTIQEVVNHRINETTVTINIPGIITLNDNVDSLEEHADRNSESIKVFTLERLKVVGKDKKSNVTYASDIVLFDGAQYIVRECLNDVQYGFCRSVAYKIEQNIE